MNQEQYYSIEFDDYSTSGFASLAKQFFGTIDEISELIGLLVADPELCGRFSDTAEALDSFLKGVVDAQHTVCYEKRRLLTPVDLIYKRDADLDSREWEHLNVWGSPYKMKADRIKASQAVFKTGDQYRVGIKCTFENLCYLGISLDGRDAWIKLNDSLWGFPNIFEVGERFHRYRLYTLKDGFSSLEEAVSVVDNEAELEFERILDDVFGDG